MATVTHRSQNRLFRSLFSTAAPLLCAAPLVACRPAAQADVPETPFTTVPSAFPARAIAPSWLGSIVEPAEAAQPAGAPAHPPIRMWTEWDGEPVPGDLRSKRAQEARLPIVQQLFHDASVPFPPAEIAFRVFKQEKQLEVWASAEKGGRAAHIATYGICAASGTLGPKRYEGDHQVPEGYYVIQYGWAESNYHLEMKVSYPNLVDKVLGPKNRPLGGEIMIHGACASIGCMATGDERAEELWVMMKTMGDGQVKVHIYPSRDMDALLRDPAHARHHAFWQNVKEGLDLFEREHRIPTVKSDWRGVYMYE
jgi:hypothetical protein